MIRQVGVHQIEAHGGQRELALALCDGLAAAQAVGTSVWRESFIPDKKPATGILMPVTASNRLVPRDSGGQPSPLSKRSNVALLGAKVFVSC